MTPVTQQTIALTALKPLEPASSHLAREPALWSQWNISKFPNEVISRIFGCLGCDEFAQVRDTCRTFREVVRCHHSEVFFYLQLPELFRSEYPRSQPWLKRMVKNRQYPFATALPRKEEDVVNGEQNAAIVCFHTLGKMVSTRKYRPMKVFARACPNHRLQLRFSPGDSNLLFYNKQGLVCMLGHSGAGSWSEQKIDFGEDSLLSLSGDASFNIPGRYFFTVIINNLIKIFHRDGDRWCFFRSLEFHTASRLKFSPFEKYLFAFDSVNGIESIMSFNDTGHWWKTVPMAVDVRIDPDIEALRFSRSEQHVAIKYQSKVLVLSLDSRGCWHRFRAIDSDFAIAYVELSPSGKWLLLACARTRVIHGYVEMIRLDSAGTILPRDQIFARYASVAFSPGGNYLVSVGGVGEAYLIWHLDKFWCRWVPYRSLTDLLTKPWPGVGQVELKKDTITFSSSDNYLLASSEHGAVTIWGKDGQGGWMVRGNEQHDGEVRFVRFSQSGLHALTVDGASVRIWGRDKSGLWSVKGKILTERVRYANFHPVAEHLIICLIDDRIQVWEIRKEE